MKTPQQTIVQGDRIRVTAGVLTGAVCLVVAKSKRTGSLTCRLLADHSPGWPAGAAVSLMPYEVALANF